MKQSGSLPCIIYDAKSKLRQPRKLARGMWKDLLSSRELAWRLLIRDINAKYRQTVLGFTWAFIPPLFAAIALTLANNADVISVKETDLPYPAYIVFSMALWQTFIAALNGPIQAVTEAKAMLARINFPREAIILAKLGEVSFDFLIKLILIIGIFIWFKIPVSLAVGLAPLIIIHLIFLGTSFGLTLAPLAALFQDLSKGLNFITTLWLLITPVVFPIPEERGILFFMIQINPVTHLIVSARELAVDGAISNPLGFLLASSFTLISLILAWILYRLSMPYVVERISS